MKTWININKLEQKDYIFCKKGCGHCCKNGQYPYSEIEAKFLLLGFFRIPLKEQQEVIKRIKVLKEDFEKKMPEQIYSSVQWVETIEKMAEKGITDYIELGAGKVLAGLNKKINPELKTYNVFDIATLNNVANEILSEEKELV